MALQLQILSNILQVNVVSVNNKLQKYLIHIIKERHLSLHIINDIIFSFNILKYNNIFGV